jgi:DnaJ-class molecular chaperone
MMPDRAARICPDCDGFPVVAVTTGTRNQDGTRTTLPAVCPACHGTGTAPHWLVTTGSPLGRQVSA